MVVRLFITVGLGLYFLSIQYEEYVESQFSISDGSYGSTFFISTGFHGVHVIVGTSILLYRFRHHFGFEAAA